MLRGGVGAVSNVVEDKFLVVFFTVTPVVPFAKTLKVFWRLESQGTLLKLLPEFFVAVKRRLINVLEATSLFKDRVGTGLLLKSDLPH